MLYRRRPLLVQALQWTGENAADVVALLEGLPPGQHVAFDPSSHAALVATEAGRARCMVGDWVVRDDDRLLVLSDDEMTRYYQEVE